MIFVTPLRRFFSLDRNGSVAEKTVEFLEEPSKEEPEVIVEFQQAETSTVFPGEQPQFRVLEDIRKLEEFLESQAGVDKAQISFKTAKDGTQSLQIAIRPTNWKLRSKQKIKLRRRLTNEVISRMPMPQEQVSIKLQRAPKDTSIS